MSRLKGLIIGIRVMLQQKTACRDTKNMKKEEIMSRHKLLYRDTTCYNIGQLDRDRGRADTEALVTIMKTGSQH